jgi:glycosyltransferase involved in cell wall biosynthesis
MSETLQFTIVTPSFRNSEWLKLCVASVADQEGVTFEHIVQDAGSDDGTLDWLLTDPRVSAFAEKDTGMYDALNRGLRRAKGEIFSYLNCDEQYLPGTLAVVQKFFAMHPDVEIVFGDVVVTDSTGRYRFHRKFLPPTLYHTWACHLSPLSCATFIRQSFIQRHQLNYDPRFRLVGDGEWMVRALQCRPKMASLRRFVSAFAETGANLSTTPDFYRELRLIWNSAPGWVQRLRPIWTLLHRVRRAILGAYSHRPFSYSVYTVSNPGERTSFHSKKPTGYWSPQSARRPV